MNGQTTITTQPTGILLALAASCLIHGVVVFFPYLGTSTRETRPTVKSSKTPAHMVNATLTTPRKAALELPPPSEASPQPPPPSVQEAVDTAQAVTDTPSPETSTDIPQNVEKPREGLDVLPVDAPVFYPTDQLTVRPQLLDTTELDTPEIKPILASGKIVMKLWINDRGEVIDTEIESSSLPENFGRSAIAVFKRMRFTPGQRQGKVVGTLMRIELDYDDGRQAPEPAPASAPTREPTPTPPQP